MIGGGYEQTARLTQKEEEAIEKAAVAISEHYGIESGKWNKEDPQLINEIYKSLYRYAGEVIIQSMNEILENEYYDEPLSGDLWERLERRAKREAV